MIKQEWNAIIEAKLKEGISVEDLKYTYAEGIKLEPNVLESDLGPYDHTVVVHEPFTNMAVIQDVETGQKNALIHQALNFGANGLSVELSSDENIKEILDGVLTEYLDVRVNCNQLSVEQISAQQALLDQKDFPHVRWISNDFHKEVKISETDRIRSIRNAVESPESNTDFVVSLSKNLMFEIASLRAIRALLDEGKVENFNIVCRYDVEGGNELGDYNLIEKTYKVVSAILGGCNAILTPFKGNEDSRLTLNIQNVLDLESGMKSVLDPLKGAHYLEKLTGEIIRQVKEES